MPYTPPFQLTHTMMRLVAEISESIGSWAAQNPDGLQPQLRRENRIRTIQASLAIEHNTLTLEQVTAVIEGKPVLGHPKEIQEVHNALASYAEMPKWSKTQVDGLLTAHRLLMKGLLDEAINASKMRVEMKVKTRVKTTDRILKLLTDNNSMTLAEVAFNLGLSKSTVERAVAKLKKQGKLSYVGPKKGGHWQVME